MNSMSLFRSSTGHYLKFPFLFHLQAIMGSDNNSNHVCKTDNKLHQNGSCARPLIANSNNGREFSTSTALQSASSSRRCNIDDVRAVYDIVGRIISREAKLFKPLTSRTTDDNNKKGTIFSKQQPFTIIVEGNIGSGKTTFLKHFKKFSQVCVVDEPVEKWRNADGHNLFDLMYKDPVKWSFCFQSYVQLTMLDLHTKPIPQAVKLMERSIFSAKYCFVNNLRAQGLIADVEYTVLNEWFNFIRENVPIKVDLIVYLRTDPETVYDRISKRGRPEENSITLDYLKSIHSLHEDWLQNKSQSHYLPCPVITIDANDDLASMVKNYKSCEETIFQQAAVAI